MRIRLFLDENSMDRNLVRGLRLRQVDVATAREEGRLGREDESQLKFSTEQGRILYSFNIGHFYHLHTVFVAQGKTHAGIVLAPQQQYSVGEQMRRLLNLIGAITAEQMKNRVEFLSAWD